MRICVNDVLAGKYRVVRMLGEGGMGIVAEAVHLGLGHRVALKLLRSELVRPDHRERFFREARAAGSLHGEHVVAIKDVDTLPDGTPFLVMEYLEGADLGGVVQQRGALPPDEAADYVLQACHAIAEAHAHGIVHRDLKPANLFLTRRPDGAPLVKVLDFGIAKIAGPEPARALTSTSQYMGSPSYMSPEQVRSAKRVDARTDVWALGVILYELVTGALPFEGETAGDVLVKISTEPPGRFAPPRPAPGLEAIILRCLEKEPDRRYRDVAELASALAWFAGATGRVRAEAVARIVGRELPTVFAPAPPLISSAPATITTLGLGAGQSQAMPRRPRNHLAIAAVAVLILGGAATWGYVRRAPEVPAAPAAIAPAQSGPAGAGPSPSGDRGEPATPAPSRIDRAVPPTPGAAPPTGPVATAGPPAFAPPASTPAVPSPADRVAPRTPAATAPPLADRAAPPMPAATAPSSTDRFAPPAPAAAAPSRAAPPVPVATAPSSTDRAALPMSAATAPSSADRTAPRAPASAPRNGPAATTGAPPASDPPPTVDANAPKAGAAGAAGSAAVTPAPARPPRKPPKPAHPAMQPDANDSDFVEDRR